MITLISGTFASGLKEEVIDPLEDKEVLRRILAMAGETSVDDVMEGIVDTGLEDILFDALTRAMDRAKEAEKLRKEAIEAEEAAMEAVT